MSNKRIPLTLLAFNDWIVQFLAFIQGFMPDGVTIKGIALLLTPDEINYIKAMTKEWTTSDPANPGIWDLHHDKRTKTPVTRTKVVKFMKDYSDYVSPLLVRMGASPAITADDRAVMNIAEPVTSHTTTKTAIKEQCYTLVKAVGGGSAQITCKWESDATRSSIPDTGDAVEIRYRVDAPVLEAAEGGDSSLTAGKVRRTTLAGPDDDTTKEISTKSKFKLKFGAEKAGFTLHIYARYIHTKRPGLEGDWTGPIWIILT
jgi:hypothetical protein